MDEIKAAAHKKSTVICAGLIRSGSTWLYNVLREILILQYPEQVYACWIGDYEPLDTREIHLIKTHSYYQKIAVKADLVFTSRRDLRDIAASMVIRNWSDQDDIQHLIDSLKQHVNSYTLWRQYSAHETVYEYMIHNKLTEIINIAQILGLDCNSHLASSISSKVESLSYEHGDQLIPYDKVNLLHPNHRKDGRVGYFIEVLQPKLISEISLQFHDWLKTYNYI
jgi:hypothetical protein